LKQQAGGVFEDRLNFKHFSPFFIKYDVLFQHVSIESPDKTHRYITKFAYDRKADDEYTVIFTEFYSSHRTHRYLMKFAYV
jgi:hypothetical protein